MPISWTPIAITAAVIVVVAIALFAFMGQQEPGTMPTASPTPEPTATPPPTATPTASPFGSAQDKPPASPTPAENLTTYRDTAAGFSFQHPQSWQTNIESRQQNRNSSVRIRLEPPTSITSDTDQNYILIAAAPAVGHGMEGYRQVEQEDRQAGGLTWEVTQWEGIQSNTGAITAVYISSGTDFAIEAYYQAANASAFEQAFDTIFHSFSLDSSEI